MDRHINDDINDDRVPSEGTLLRMAVVPGLLAALSRLDITERLVFRNRTIVATGAYGDIYIAECSIGRRRHVKVAAKRFRVHVQSDVKRLLEKEVYVWTKLRHANVLPLLGYAFDRETGYPMLVSKWMKNGSAWTYVTSNPHCDLLHLITGIAQGLVYLHTNGIIHSDIKSANVLVSDREEALICDFGFARMIDASRSLGNMSSGVKGTPQYLSYELLTNPTAMHTKESDVWAFGITIYELYTRARPYGTCTEFQVLSRIMQRELPVFPSTPVIPHSSGLADTFQEICTKCWIFEPSERAQMASILETLHEQQTVVPISGSVLHSAGTYLLLLDYNPSATHTVNSGLESSTTSASSLASLPPLTILAAYPPVPPASCGIFLDDLNSDTLPPGYKKERGDWSVVFNPKLKRVLDVNLTHTLVHEGAVFCVRFSADGRYLATCDGTTRIYDMKTGQRIYFLNDEDIIYSLCFSPDGKKKLLATAGKGATIRIWGIDKNRVDRVFEGHEGKIYSLAFSKTGRLLASGSYDRTARVWNMETGMYKVFEADDAVGDIDSVAISPDEQLVAAGSGDSTVQIWELQSGNLIETLVGHREPVCSVAFIPDGMGIVSGSADKTLKYWDISTIANNSLGDPLLTSSTSIISGTSNSSSGAAICTKDGGECGSTVTLNFAGHKDCVRSVAVSHDGMWFASGSSDNRVMFWDARNAQVQFILHGHKEMVSSVEFSPTGGMFATGSKDGRARIWTYSTI